MNYGVCFRSWLCSISAFQKRVSIFGLLALTKMGEVENNTCECAIRIPLSDLKSGCG
jgi:hypothetical protein